MQILPHLYQEHGNMYEACLSIDNLELLLVNDDELTARRRIVWISTNQDGSHGACRRHPNRKQQKRD